MAVNEQINAVENETDILGVDAENPCTTQEGLALGETTKRNSKQAAGSPSMQDPATTKKEGVAPDSKLTVNSNESPKNPAKSPHLAKTKTEPQQKSKSPSKAKKAKKAVTPEDSGEDSSSSDSSDGEETQKVKKKRRKQKSNVKAEAKAMKEAKKEKSKEVSSDSDSSSSSSDEDEKSKKKEAKKKHDAKASKSKSAKTKSKAVTGKKSKKQEESETSDSDSDSSDGDEKTEVSHSEDQAQPGASATVVVTHQNPLKCAIAQLEALRLHNPGSTTSATTKAPAANQIDSSDSDSKKADKGSKPEFVRLDKVWSRREYRFVTQPSTEAGKIEKYEEYAFNVVRRMDYQNRYQDTRLDIISKPLKRALYHVMGKESGISLEVDKPSVDPNMAFLYLDELQSYRKELRKRIKKTKKKQKAKKAELKTERKHLKILVKYLDKDYEETKKSLLPLLKNGKITFDLVWALFKCNDIIYTSTYNHEEQPRAAKVVYVSKEKSVLHGWYYDIDAKFLDNDGKRFGTATTCLEVKAFQGVRPITSLAVYPLKYHPQHEMLWTQLIERGKKFVALEGKQYKAMNGIAYHKRDGKIIKVSVTGRVMIDPSTFRRLRPNYPFSTVKPPDKDIIEEPVSDAAIDDINATSSSSEDDASQSDPMTDHPKKQKKQKKHRLKAMEDSEDPDEIFFVDVTGMEDEQQEAPELAPLTNKEDNEKENKAGTKSPLQQSSMPKKNSEEEPEYNFTDIDYLIASPVALGFSFSEKLWLEFSVSSLSEIAFNDSAFDNLILPNDQKTVVKALVESHAYENDGNNIDDVIMGKGRGLVAVLHGPPGTGKTLTAEGIAELLRKPLYAVSVGELGIKGGDVERNLSTILDVAHTWGALLLLDEADVFLEQRTNYDLGRNALVSIFLRMLEYFQGILFLTTNRVQVFDEAFASRIHIGLRYGTLDLRARKGVWKVFIDKVRSLEKTSVGSSATTSSDTTIPGEADIKPQEHPPPSPSPKKLVNLGVEPGAFSDSDMARLASFELNGREIKNAVRTAQSVALINKERLGMKHMLQVLAVGNVFAKDLKGAGYEEAMKFYM